ncbi:N-acyl homoserine lactonase family protein [Stappia indica]|uniref:N-acyl homoserine lactonase family protein n=1 Tax=Stappia indica TaxID=538381 RepID=UPI001CD5B889|nr:N-acyl homoserine lactonase family protein [Stappia indica]MCA1300632.1 N-acyl homoserine lactonase family protein [Stappia indica]
MTYDLFALRYGRQPDLAIEETGVFPQDWTPEEERQPFSYYFWLARSASSCVLVDCGFSPEQGHARGKETILPVGDLLDEIGVSPDQIEDIVLSHLHYDHVGNLGLFPRARLHVHAREWAWATGLAMADAAASRYYDRSDMTVLLDRLFSGKLRLIAQDHLEFKGLGLTHVGGHSPGQMIIEVPTSTGPVVLASDASHLDRNWQQRNPFPIIHEQAASLDACALLARKAEDGARIIAGHEPSVLQKHQSAGRSGNVVALHRPIGNAGMI